MLCNLRPPPPVEAFVLAHCVEFLTYGALFVVVLLLVVSKDGRAVVVLKTVALVVMVQVTVVVLKAGGAGHYKAKPQRGTLETMQCHQQVNLVEHFRLPMVVMLMAMVIGLSRHSW